MFVESSSMINLTCLVAWTAKPPDKVEKKLAIKAPGGQACAVAAWERCLDEIDNCT